MSSINNENSSNNNVDNGTKIKKKKRNKSDLGDDFIAPDGGYAWVVCVATGLSHLCGSSIGHAFGMIFNDMFVDLKFTGTQITSITNVQSVVRSSSGFFNGELFRRYSFRKVAVTGALLSTFGVFLMSFSTTFIEFIIWYSVIFGLGTALSGPATSLAVNTYFLINRRRARSYQMTITLAGAVFIPYLVNFLLDFYGVLGTVIMFCGICFHSLPLALLLQPAQWHEKKITDNVNEKIKEPCKDCEKLQNDDEGIRLRISNAKRKLSNFSMKRKFSLHEKGFNHLKDLKQSDRRFSENIHPYAMACFSCRKEKLLEDLKKLEKDNQLMENSEKNRETSNEVVRKNWNYKIVKFLDLDLLKDLTFLNIMLGLTLSNFAERNTVMLKVFFLRDFGFTKEEVAIILSSQTISDIVATFSIPIFTRGLKWNSRTFYLIGLGGVVICHIFISTVPSFKITLLLYILVGAFKAYKNVFMSLILPDYLPLKRLPAASGLHRTISGVITIVFGPFIGLIKDFTNYSVTINVLNLFSMLTIIMWTTEMCYKKWKKNKLKEIK